MVSNKTNLICEKKKSKGHKNIRVFYHGTAESNYFSITFFDQTIVLAFYSNKRWKELGVLSVCRHFVSFYVHKKIYEE
jgi:hypothetical protein